MRLRLVLGFAAVLALTGAIGLARWTRLRSETGTYETLVQRDARPASDDLRMKVALGDEATGVRGSPTRPTCSR